MTIIDQRASDADARGVRLAADDEGELQLRLPAFGAIVLCETRFDTFDLLLLRG